MALPKKIKNFNMFIDGVAYIGRATEVVLPKLTRKMEEYRGAGMNGPVDIDQGMEKLETEITIAEYSPDLLKTYGVTGVDAVSLRFRGAGLADTGGSETDTIEVVMRGRFREVDFGTNKAGEETTMKLTGSLSYYKYVLNGEELIEIDLLNMVERVGGVDRLEQQRAALGA